MLDLYEKTWHAVASREASQDAFFKGVGEFTVFSRQYQEWGSRAFLPRRKTSTH